MRRIRSDSMRRSAAKTIAPPRAGKGKEAAKGFLLGTLIGLCLSELGLGEIVHIQNYLIPAAAAAGALLFLTRARRLLWLLAGLLVAGVIIIGYTPLAHALLPQVERRDPLQPAPAVVVLSASLHPDKTMNATGQERVLQGYALLRQGLAPRLVLTNEVVPNGSAVPTVRRQMKTLGLDYPVDEVGPVFNTHDEAVKVAQLARERGWQRVILVTHAWHERRAAAVFEKAGLPVISCPCVEAEYDETTLSSPEARLHAFRVWLHEIIGYQVYRLRGWI